MLIIGGEGTRCNLFDPDRALPVGPAVPISRQRQKAAKPGRCWRSQLVSLC